MEKKMKECMKPHALMHLVTGAGLGLLLVGLVPDLAASAMTYGLVVVVVGVVGDFMVNK